MADPKKTPLVGPSLAGPSKEAPVVSVAMPALTLRGMRFTPSEHEDKRHFHYLYANSAEHAKKSADLKGLGRGPRFDVAEWATKATKSPRNFPLCYRRGSPVHMSVLFRTTGLKTKMSVKFTVEPRVDGKTGVLLPTELSLDCEPTDISPLGFVTLLGALPDDRIGRMKLELEFHCLTPGVFFHNAKARVRTEHHVYVTYDVPLDPKSGQETAAKQGSLTGTPARLKQLVELLGESKQHAITSADELKELYWKVHKGINDRNPPYFYGGNSERITVDAFPDFDGKPVPEWPEDKLLDVSDQWLMWLKTESEKKKVDVGGKMVWKERRWNDASCIGHAQLQKTMMAVVGMKGHLAWVFPHTTLLPKYGTDPSGKHSPGDTITFSDDELFAVDQFDNKKRQWWVFEAVVPNRKGEMRKVKFDATVVLMHGNPKETWEVFEGCFRSPQGLFLTGGFPTSRNPPSFRKNRGFRTATAARLVDDPQGGRSETVPLLGLEHRQSGGFHLVVRSFRQPLQRRGGDSEGGERSRVEAMTSRRNGAERETDREAGSVTVLR